MLNEQEIMKKVLVKYYADTSEFDMEDTETEKEKIMKITIQLCREEFKDSIPISKVEEIIDNRITKIRNDAKKHSNETYGFERQTSWDDAQIEILEELKSAIRKEAKRE